jgi:3-hydroxyacyl-[acyl-carrier-protein] dehydratase
MTDTPATEVDVQMIQRIIPHRYPFLFVDRVTEIVPHVSGTGLKNVTINEPFFQGHFPGKPVMPGVAIVEAMGQTAGVIVGVSNDLVDKAFGVYFMALDGCKFRRPVVPGDRLTMRLEVTRGKPGAKVWKFLGRAEVEGELAAEAHLTAMMDIPK